SWDGFVYALSPTGLLLWEYYAGDVVYSSPALGADGTIYIGAGEKLLALSPTGFLVWEYETAGLVDSSPAIGSDGTTIYVGSGDGSLHAVKSQDGTARWTYPTEGPIFSSPAIAANG